MTLLWSEDRQTFLYEPSATASSPWQERVCAPNTPVWDRTGSTTCSFFSALISAAHKKKYDVRHVGGDGDISIEMDICELSLLFQNYFCTGL